MNLTPGRRVYLRTPRPRDRDEVLDCFRRSRSLHRPWTSGPADARAFERYLRRVGGDTHEGFLVCRIEDHAIVGVVNLSEIVRGALCSAYVGYSAFLPHAGKGYMSEGLIRVMRQAFVELKLHRLEANIQPGNLASIALAKRCGFRLEGFSPRYLKIGGRWRDHQRWAITREGWSPIGPRG